MMTVQTGILKFRCDYRKLWMRLSRLSEIDTDDYVLAPDGTPTMPVPGVEPYYATEDGRIFCERAKKRGRVKLIELAQAIVSGKYPMVKLWIGGRHVGVLVGRLVLMSWIGSGERKHVHHANGRKDDCHIENLSWVQQRKMSDSDVIEILSDPESSHADLAKRIGYSPAAVRFVRIGATHKHIPRDEFPCWQTQYHQLSDSDAWRIKHIEDGTNVEVAEKYSTSANYVNALRQNKYRKHLRADAPPADCIAGAPS